MNPSPHLPPSTLEARLPLVGGILFAAFLAVLATRGYGETTTLLVLSSLLMFGCCWASAAHLLGARAALRLVLIATSLGWLAEELGADRGWFFGDYDYTDVLGPRLGAVPIVIPMMWFALCYTGYVIANLIVWQAPSDSATSPTRGQHLLMSLLGAMVVTCYDLGVDPYMVYKLKAWIMVDKDGWWFGETVQGFAGWMFVSFTILLAFRLGLRGKLPVPAAPVALRHTLVPLGVYGGLMLFQVCLGYPMEARTIALFAMGFPLLAAACGLLRWQREAAGLAVPAIEAAPEAVAAAPVREAA
jgi:putative membrane protein